jgi:hypothetical protein
MVDTPERKADTPRESFAHLLYVQRVYMNGVRAGKLEFKSMGVEHDARLSKEQLLAEWARMDQEMLSELTAEAFDRQAIVEVSWGGSLSVPRFESFIHYWGP